MVNTSFIEEDILAWRPMKALDFYVDFDLNFFLQFFSYDTKNYMVENQVRLIKLHESYIWC